MPSRHEPRPGSSAGGPGPGATRRRQRPCERFRSATILRSHSGPPEGSRTLVVLLHPGNDLLPGHQLDSKLGYRTPGSDGFRDALLRSSPKRHGDEGWENVLERDAQPIHRCDNELSVTSALVPTAGDRKTLLPENSDMLFALGLFTRRMRPQEQRRPLTGNERRLGAPEDGLSLYHNMTIIRRS